MGGGGVASPGGVIVRAWVAYTVEARGALHAMLSSTHDEYARRVTRRQRLAQEDSELAARFEGVGDAITEGLARSRRTPRTPTEPSG